MIEAVHFSPCYPGLEDKLAGEVAVRGASLGRLVVLVPSSAVRKRLAVMLAAERRIPLFNVEILTFHQLASRVAGWAGEPADDFLFEEVLRHRLKRLPSSFSPLAKTASGCAALWQTLRDLKEAQTDPALLVQAVCEGFVAREAEALFRLYVNHAAAARRLPDRTDTIRQAIDRLPDAAFLSGVDPVFFYGFYDLTQIEIDFLAALCHRFRTVLFFPLAHDDPAWSFAQRFYERRLIGLVSPTVRPPQNGAPPVFAAATTVISCAGIDEEIGTVAREIVRLVEEEGVDYNQIGVVARHLSHDLLIPLTDRFRKYAIPTLLAADRPLSDFPYVQSLLRLGELLADDFSRSAVLSFLAATGSCSAPDALPRIDLWEAATRRLGILRGWEDWKRLGPHLKEAGARATDAEARGRLQETARLWQAVSRLHARLAALPLRASWSTYVDLWRGVIKATIKATMPVATADRGQSPDEEVIEKTASFLDTLALLDRVMPVVERSDFLDTFCRGLRRATVAWGRTGERESGHGVTVCDAVTARGLTFRALFVLGMTEGSFPRAVREDPFLRDGVRRAVETTLGNKLDERLAGVDEERLLFVLLAGSARERLYCLHSRTDPSGTPQSPSVYLDEIGQRTANLSARRVGRGVAFGPSALIPPEEVALRLRLAGKEVHPLVPAQRAIYERGCRVEAVQAGAAGLTPYDGLPGDGPVLALRRDGLSTTGLVRYATCPFQFFAGEILSLRSAQEETGEIAASERGSLCHQILAAYYRSRIDPAARPPLREVAQREMTAWATRHPTGYPTAWEAQQERLIRMLERVVSEDEAENGKSGLRPAFVERACDGVIGPFPVAGRIDRIDTAPDRCKIIDYKYTEAKSPSSPHPLQLGIYRQLARQQTDLPGEPGEIEAAFFHLMPNRPEGPLKIAPFRKTEEEVASTLEQVVSDLEAALFFIRPGPYCHGCDMKSLCRKNHAPSRRRATSDPRTQPHAQK